MTQGRRKLTGWKEIADHIGQSVRTAQRWERQFALPVHRPSGRNTGAVFCFADEVDGWLSRTAVRERPYVRPVLLVLDPPNHEALSTRKLELENRKFNVLTAFTTNEVRATLARFDVDGVVIDYTQLGDAARELCADVKQRTPPPAVILLHSGEDDSVQEIGADHLVGDDGSQSTALGELAVELFGVPRLT